MKAYADDDRTPVADSMFLSAQSQMWIFAAYELLRTWRARAKATLKLHENGGLDLKIAALRDTPGFRHIGAEMRADQFARFRDDASLVQQLREHLRRSHIPFRRMEALRVSLAKHEVAGRPDALPFAPGYARIDHFSRTMRYEIFGPAHLRGNDAPGCRR